jgi:hypothetical protein
MTTQSAATRDASIGAAGSTDVWIGAFTHPIDHVINNESAAVRTAVLPEALAEAFRQASMSIGAPFERCPRYCAGVTAAPPAATIPVGASASRNTPSEELDSQ